MKSYSLTLLLCLVTSSPASAQSLLLARPEVRDYVQGKVFEIYEPTVCAAPKTGEDGYYRIANTCPTPIEVIFCTNLSVDENANTSCTAPFERNLWTGGYQLANYPGFSLEASNSRKKATAVAVFTCPIDPTVRTSNPLDYGRYFNVFSVARNGFAITGKCLRPVTNVQKSAIRRVLWPLYKDRVVIEVTGPGAENLPEADSPSRNDSVPSKGPGMSPAVEGAPNSKLPDIAYQYFVQATTVDNQLTAKQSSDFLRSLGFRSAITTTASGLLRVRVGPYTSKDEAERALEAIRTSGPSAYTRATLVRTSP